MSRSIEFIAPVEAMRGNLSGKQDLLYPTKNNSAFDAPSDKTSYATNYQPRYIGNKRSASGKKYFAVKRKSAVHITSAQRLAMALLAMSQTIAAYIEQNAPTTPVNVLAQLQSRWNTDVQGGYYKGTFRAWLAVFVREALLYKRHINVTNLSGTRSSIYFRNPYISTTLPVTGHEVAINKRLLVRFWMQLADNAITFSVAGQTGIARSGMTFAQVISNSTLNVLLLDLTQDQPAYITLGQQSIYLLNTEGDFVTEDNVIANSAIFTTTTESPV